MLLALFVSAAPAETTQTGDDPAAQLAVAGVKLGMTPEEAIEALRKFDSWPILSRRYASGYLNIGVLGSTDACVTRIPANPLRMMVAIVAAKGPRIPGTYRNEYYGKVPSRFTKAQLAATSECGWAGLPAPVKEDDDPMEVAVYLSPVPGRERVIAVSLWRSFRDPPLVAAVVDSALKQFPGDPTMKVSRGSEDRIAWRYDARGRIMSEAVARGSGALDTLAGLDGGPSVPHSARQGDGLALDVYVGHDPRNGQIAQLYSFSLYTGRGLFDFVQQAKSTYNAMLENKKEKDIEKAKAASSRILGASTTAIQTADADSHGALTSQAAGPEPSETHAAPTTVTQPGRTLASFDGTDAFFLQYVVSGAEPPFRELAKLDPAYRSANEFNRDAVVGRLEAQLRARAEAVKGVRFLQINLSNSFGEYDSKYKEFDFSIDTGNTVDFSAFGRRIQLAFTNGGLARNWKVEPREAEDLLRRTNGDRQVVLAMKLEIIDAVPPVSGMPLVINTRILEYEIRSRRNLRLGSVSVAQ